MELRPIFFSGLEIAAFFIFLVILAPIVYDNLNMAFSAPYYEPLPCSNDRITDIPLLPLFSIIISAAVVLAVVMTLCREPESKEGDK